MKLNWKNLLQIDLPAQANREDLEKISRERNWGLAAVVIGWIHLVAFSCCHFLTVAGDYHEAPGYLLVWATEFLAALAVLRLCAGKRTYPRTPSPLKQFIERVWIGYFVLAFNLASMNAVRGHELFELFPAMATLASFAFLMMTVMVNWRFIGAVLVMFATGLLMAMNLLNSYLIFAVAWWLVLNGIGLELWVRRRKLQSLGLKRMTPTGFEPVSRP